MPYSTFFVKCGIHYNTVDADCNTVDWPRRSYFLFQGERRADRNYEHSVNFVDDFPHFSVLYKNPKNFCAMCQTFKKPLDKSFKIVYTIYIR